MPLIILDSHLSTNDKLNYIFNNDDKETTYYLVFNTFTIDDIDNLLSTSFNSNVNLVLTRTQNLKLYTHVVIKLINKFKIIYLNNSANLYHYQILKNSIYLLNTTDKLIHYELDSNYHYLIGLLKYINSKQINIDLQSTNTKHKISILSDKHIDNIPEELSNLEINYLEREIIPIIENQANNEKKSLAKMSDINKRLKFLHISKCAGTIIEDIAKDEGIFWGRYDKSLNGDNLLKKWSNIKSDLYHLVPDCFENEVYNLDKGNDMKTFCVVREPYSRIVSEVFCNWMGILNTIENPTYKDYNMFIEKYLDIVETRKNTQHWWPQYKYIYDENGKKMIDHVLYLENLNQEFNELMIEYDIPLQLKKQKVNESKKLYGLGEISNYNLLKINKIYNDDFKLSEQYKKIKVDTIQEMEELGEISLESDFVVVSGLWNVLKEDDIDFNNIEKFIKRLRNYNLYFYYDDEKVKNKIIEINESKKEETKNNITFINLKIEDLPTFELCKNNINYIINKYPDILEEIQKYDELDKSKFNLDSYLGEHIKNSDTFVNLMNYNKDLYIRILTIITSKILLLKDIITRTNFKYLNWADTTVLNSNDMYKIKCCFKNIPFQQNRINLYKSIMKRKNNLIKYSTNLILSDRNTINNLVDLYNEEIKKCFNEKYLHDDETIIDVIRLDNPNLFCSID